MKIDIHTHTKKCKLGDAHTRAITPERFVEVIRSTDVKIVAITNHNVFDLEQFKKIQELLSDGIQVWPGVELDVVDDSVRGHLLVIVAPEKANELSTVLEKLTDGKSADVFTTNVDGVLKTFDKLQPLYVAHYKHKQPSISERALEKLEAGTSNPELIMKEVTNAFSAGIYIAHGHRSIYGSDGHDWDKYEELSRKLPDLRLAVDSFKHFCLLLKKDSGTINTLLEKKTFEDLLLSPFEDASTLKVRVYNDINVIFGSKGTGKSCILKAIMRHYAERGIEVRLYESGGTDKFEETFDIKGRDLRINLDDYGMNYCTNEIGAILSASEVGVIGLSSYVTYFEMKSASGNSKKIKLKDIEIQQQGVAKRKFAEINKAFEKVKGFLHYVDESDVFKKELGVEEYEQLQRILTRLFTRLAKGRWEAFSSWQEIVLLNSAIKSFRKVVAQKTGAPAKPATTGFREYAINRLNIESGATEILRNVTTEIPSQKQYVGNLGAIKGELGFITEFSFPSAAETQRDGSLFALSQDAKKTTQKDFINCIGKIKEAACSDTLFHSIAELNKIEDVEKIKSLFELLQFKRFFALNGVPYEPSGGERSMVMLQKELNSDREVYILDEPEKSLGNEYISEIIVPLLKEKARAGKKIFISTHDANIAVRTLPYRSIYRRHGIEGYSTYIGNPFSNNLVNLEDAAERLDWQKISMTTLEGGVEAFGERGDIYGHAKS